MKMSSEKQFKEILNFKRAIELIRIRLILQSLILVGALVDYHLLRDALPVLLILSAISLLELAFSRQFSSLLNFTESVIDSDPEMLKLKAKLNDNKT